MVEQLNPQESDITHNAVSDFTKRVLRCVADFEHRNNEHCSGYTLAEMLWENEIPVRTEGATSGNYRKGYGMRANTACRAIVKEGYLREIYSHKHKSTYFVLTDAGRKVLQAGE